MVPQWIIEKKRDGQSISESELREFVAAYAANQLPDYQMAAFAMAVYFKGMSFEETTILTDAMMHSGEVLQWTSLNRPTVDKHSTGGIGDKISLPLAPLVAAAGAAVPMISGRGLGITGGTLDKLEAIPGYQTRLSIPEFEKVLQTVGCSIIGQTAQLAPVDKALYALRDVTGTVPSIPLITASILSKKLAEGAEGLVFDVKCGRAAFMKTREAAESLATHLVTISRNMGRKATAFVTAMDCPLGQSIGNATEIAETLRVLRNEGPEDVTQLTLTLGAEMLVLAGCCSTSTEARTLLQQKLESGAGLETFGKMIAAHGGDARIIDDSNRLPQAPVICDWPSPESGYLADIDADALGRVVLLLGGGRRQHTDAINPAVGIDSLMPLGSAVTQGQSLLRILAANASDIPAITPLLQQAFHFSPIPPQLKPLVYC